MVNVTATTTLPVRSKPRIRWKVSDALGASAFVLTIRSRITLQTAVSFGDSAAAGARSFTVSQLRYTVGIPYADVYRKGCMVGA